MIVMPRHLRVIRLCGSLPDMLASLFDQKHLFLAGSIRERGLLILRGLRARFQKGFWRMPEPTV